MSKSGSLGMGKMEYCGGADIGMNLGSSQVISIIQKHDRENGAAQGVFCIVSGLR